MEYLIKFIRIFKSINNYFLSLINYTTLKRYNVKYCNFPKIKGRLIIKNKGTIQFGINLTFNSSFHSNYVGLTKPCSIIVKGNGVLEISDHTGLSGVSIYCTNYIKIGKYCNIGGNTFIWDTDFHPLDYKDRRNNNEKRIKNSSIIIGNDVFIGANSTILKGVTIGDRSIIGTGSVVTKHIPCDEIWAGNPAKFIRKINNPC